MKAISKLHKESMLTKAESKRTLNPNSSFKTIEVSDIPSFYSPGRDDATTPRQCKSFRSIE